ncbi:hypothetical protein ABT346_16430 [Micromonospora peucetia]|uniref:hypothetical protein n=1 Tax=Micromonospora peucetia TaxID=47871 RepID=UPI0033191A45
MTGYLAALAALAVDAAPRLRPRTVGRFEPEQPEAGGGFEAYDVEREAPVVPRPAARPTAPTAPTATRVQAPEPAAVAPPPATPAPAWDHPTPPAAPPSRTRRGRRTRPR